MFRETIFPGLAARPGHTGRSIFTLLREVGIGENISLTSSYLMATSGLTT